MHLRVNGRSFTQIPISLEGLREGKENVLDSEQGLHGSGIHSDCDASRVSFSFPHRLDKGRDLERREIVPM